METLALRVIGVESLTPAIRKIVLAQADGAPLPAAAPGAHIRVHIPPAGAALPYMASQDADKRAYSLLMLDQRERDADAPWRHYQIAVKREDEGKGGSRFMHALAAGDVLHADLPRNDFGLDAHSMAPPVLLAGGIGVTPIVAMAGALVKAQRRFALHYAGREHTQMALLDELRALAGEQLRLHVDGDASCLDIARLLREMQPDQHLYVSGPAGMLDSVLAAAQAQGMPRERVHFELFNNPVAEQEGEAFEVQLRQSGKVYLIPAGKTILEVLEENGEDPMCDCRRGECGVCQVGVLEGTPEHHDYVLSDAERAEGKLMHICVSRSKSARLVLDL